VKDANPQGGAATISPVINTIKIGHRLPFSCQTIADFFFADETGTLPDTLNFKEVDLIYNDYVCVMTAVHLKLQTHYNKFVKILLNEKQREKYSLQ
jgi:hypothetical protein